MAREPVVSWTTPLMRAERSLAAAGADLEFRRTEQALAHLRAHLEHIRDLVAFIQAGGVKT